MEVWKEIIGFEGYSVSDYGRIISVKRGYPIIRSQTITKLGYNQISLNKPTGGLKSFLVHTIVAKAFVENPNNLPFVNHKDGNKLNNHISNLEWCTQKENIRHAWAVGLCKKRVGKESRLFGIPLPKKTRDKISLSDRGYRKVLNTKTGEIYRNMAVAADAIGHNKHYLRHKLNPNNKTAKNDTDLILLDK